jgi:hypothetical protein
LYGTEIGKHLYEIGFISYGNWMPVGFRWSTEQSGLALVLEPEALAIDADDRVVEDAIQHRGGQDAVAEQYPNCRRVRFEVRIIGPRL